MRRAAKVAAGVGGGVVGLLIVLVGLVLIIPNTERGRAWITRATRELTHGAVQLTGIHGTFPASLDLDRLELRDAQGPWLWADHVALRWSPAALLARHIDVRSLHVAVLHVERLPVSETTSAGSSSVPDTDVKDLTVDTLELGRALAGDPASLALRASAHIRSLEDAEVSLKARRIDGDGVYDVDAHFDPRSLQATVHLQEPAHGPLANLLKIPQAGALTVAATLAGPRSAEAVRVSMAVGPLQALADGRVDLVNKAVDLTYSVRAPQMSPSAGLGWQKIDIQGQLHGPIASLMANGHLLISEFRAPGGIQLAELDAQVKGDRGQIGMAAQIDGLQVPGAAPHLFQDSRVALTAAVRLDDPQRPLSLLARHRLLTLKVNAVTAGHLKGDLTLDVPDLKPLAPLVGMTLKGNAQLVAHVDYTPSATRLTADLSSHLDGAEAAWAGLVRGGLTQLHAAVELTEQRVTLQTLQLTGSAISLTAQAQMNRTGDQQVKAQFDLGLPDVHRVAPTLAGNAKVKGSLTGALQNLTADTRLTARLSVRGSAAGTVTARVQARGLPNAPQGTVEASGTLDGAPLQVEMAVDPVKEGGYHATIRRAEWKSAHAEGDVTIGKTVAEVRGAVRGRLGNLSDFDHLSGQQLAGSMTAQATFTGSKQGSRAQVELQAQHVVAGGITINARLRAEGPLDALAVTLNGDAAAKPDQPARFDAASVVNLTAHELQLTKLDASYHDQALRLLGPATVQFAPRVAIQHLKLGVHDASVEVNGEMSPALEVTAAVRHLDAALVNAIVPGLLSSGTLDADAAIQGTVAAPTGKVHVQALNVKAQGAGAAGLPGTDVRADVLLNGTTAQVEAHLATGKASQVSLTGQAPLGAGAQMNLKLAGTLDLALANPILEASGRHVTGTMALDTTVKGTTTAPQIAGTVRLSNGTVRDYSQGITLTDIKGELAGDQGVLRIQSLTARAAPGDIAIQGTLGVLQPKVPVDITVTAKNAQPIASNIVTANLDTDVHIGGTVLEQLEVTGKVHVNRATISIPGGLPAEVAVLDVERDGALPAPPPRHPLTIKLQVDVEAPNRVLITGRGLDAEMGGTLQVRGTSAAPRVSGGFELQRGSFTLASSKLNFVNGTVTFNGSGLDQKLDPSLDFMAQTSVSDATVSVHITGFADAPKIELSSTPALPSDEILSRLLFGEPAAQLTAVQLLEIAPALASLQGGSNGPSLNPLTRIQKALGLDRLSVGSESSTSSGSTAGQTSGASVSAGRYVSSRVYVGVKEGTSGSSQVDVDVDLTKNLKLQAQLGNGTATAQGVTPDNDPGSSLGLSYQVDY